MPPYNKVPFNDHKKVAVPILLRHCTGNNTKSRPLRIIIVFIVGIWYFCRCMGNVNDNVVLIQAVNEKYGHGSYNNDFSPKTEVLTSKER